MTARAMEASSDGSLLSGSGSGSSGSGSGGGVDSGAGAGLEGRSQRWPGSNAGDSMRNEGSAVTPSRPSRLSRILSIVYAPKSLFGDHNPPAEQPSRREAALFQTRVMRLTNPNDELGGMLFLATPQLVSHRIDRWSPLFPPKAFAPPTVLPKVGEKSLQHAPKMPPRPTFPGLVLRDDDVDANDLFER